MSYSVIIPAYNASRTVADSIESALSQTRPAEEIVVVDDGSADDTAAVVERHSPPVQLIRQVNAGPSVARNTAVRESKGEWLAFLDADDTWHPHKMERQLALAHDPNVGVIHARGPSHRYPAPPSVTEADLWNANCIALSSAIVRRTAFEAVGGFDPGLRSAEDHNLWLRLAASGWTILTCPEDLIRYTPAPGSLSQQGEKFYREVFKGYDKAGKLLGMDPELVRRKILDLHTLYARDLIHRRDPRGARRLLAAPLLERPSLEALFLWATSLMPTKLLDLRRSLSGNRAGSRRGRAGDGGAATDRARGA